MVLDETAPTKRLHDLGIEATSMEMPGFNFLHRYRSGSHFLESAYFGGAERGEAKTRCLVLVSITYALSFHAFPLSLLPAPSQSPRRTRKWQPPTFF